MRSADLAPACVVDAQSGADTVVPWEEGAGSGGLGAAEWGVKGKDQHQQRQQQQRRQARDEEHRLHPQLPTGPFLRVLELLPPHDRACSGRMACRDAWRHLSGVHHRTAHLSQPLPPHAVPWFERYGPEALKQLNLTDRLLQPMCAAAASGSEANLAAVWGLVRQGFLPELLLSGKNMYSIDVETPCEVLVREGHAHLLPWLMDNGYPIDAPETLCAAAHHCDLAGLQAVWQLLQPRFHRYPDWAWDAVLARAAESSATEHAIAKMGWLMQQEAYRPMGRLPLYVAQVAVKTGDIPRLRWMLQRGCEWDYSKDENMTEWERTISVLPTAMRHAGLEVVEWLVREAGCQLPPPALVAEEGGGEGAPLSLRRLDLVSRKDLAVAAAESGDVAKLSWLRDRGLLPLEPSLRKDLIEAAARWGRAEALRYLHEEGGHSLTLDVWRAAVGSGDVETAAWVLHAGGMELFADRGGVWKAAAHSGSLDMVRWAVEQGLVGAGNAVAAVYDLIAAGCWFRRAQQWQPQRESLMSAVRLVFEAAGDLGGSGSSFGGNGGGGSGGGPGVGGRVAGASGHSKALADKLLVAAAGRANLPLFTFLHSRLQPQNPLGPAVLQGAVGTGCEALVEWLLGHGCALPEDTTELFLTPAEHGDLAMIRCMRRMGLSWPRGLLPGALMVEVPLPVLQWLVAQGVPTDEDGVAEAVGWAEDRLRLRAATPGDERLMGEAGGVEAWLRGLAAEVSAREATRGAGGGHG